MAHVYGQIDSLKQIRYKLNLKGIDRFNSIKEIKFFLENYQSEKTTVIKHFEDELENEINKLKENIKINHQVSEELKKTKIDELDARIKLNNILLENYQRKDKGSIVTKFFNRIVILLLDIRRKYLHNNYDIIISRSMNKIKGNIESDTEKLIGFIENKKEVVSERSSKKVEDLVYTKKAVEEINPLIAGAIGENLVANEITKLSDDYTLINDFSITFDPPIYNRKENDRIYSIQIDHLLISKSGVFILETKNWSKNSIKSLELRSPIKQINRTRFTLFVLLNSKKTELEWHHWGEKQIPIRSLVVMINHKPKEKFKFVKIVLLKDLNRYVKFFDPIFSDKEYSQVSKYLLHLNNSDKSSR